MNDKNFTSVWRGLDPYREEDADSFFGRDAEAEQLCSAVAQTPLCVVYGASGSGKTSLVRAGLFPRLRSCGFIPVYVLFDHSATASPFEEQIKTAVLEAVKTAHCDTVEACAPISNDRPETLWEWFHRHGFVNAFRQTVRPVVVIDQFEEIFTVGEERGSTDALLSDLADLAENYVPDVVVRDMEKSESGFGFPADEQNWRIVVGLREDFLPRLEERTQKLPVFRRSRFAVGAFRREQALEAVTGPGGALCAREVAEAIVDTVGRTKAGAPVTVEPALLSLFCMRLDRARQEASLDEISLPLVREKGKDILNTFYEESMSGVSEKTRDILEDWLLTASGFRDSMAIEDAEAEGASREELARLVRDRLLHVEYRGGVRWLELSHDILAPVARENRDSRKRNREMEALKLKLKAQRRRIRRLAIGLVALVGLFLGVAQTYWLLFCKEQAVYCTAFTKAWGAPVPVGHPIGPEGVRHRPFSFKIISRGRFTHSRSFPFFAPSLPHRVEALDLQFRPTTKHGMGTYLWRGEDTTAALKPMAANAVLNDSAMSSTNAAPVLRSAFQTSDKLANVCAWEYLYDADGRPLAELGLDASNAVVWSTQYAPPIGSHFSWKTNALLHFADASGFPVHQRTNDAEYVRISYDSRGLESRIEFLSATNTHVKGPDGAHAQRFLYDDLRHCTQFWSQAWIPATSDYTNCIDEAGNCGMSIEYHAEGNVRTHRSFGIDFEPHPVTAGYAIVVGEFDDWDNPIRLAYYGMETNAVPDDDGVPVYEYEWIDGVRTRMAFFERPGMPATNHDGISLVTESSVDGILVQEDCFAPDGQGGVWGDTNVHHVVHLFNRDGNCTSLSHFDSEGLPTTDNEGVALVSNVYSGSLLVRRDFFAPKGRGGAFGWPNVHRVVQLYDDNGNKTNEWYLAADDETEAVDNNGIARETYLYAPGTNRRIRCDLFAPKGQGGVFGWTNVHHVVRLYDGNGNMTNDWYLAVDDVTEVANDNGLARGVYIPDLATGHDVRRDFFAPKGQGGVYGAENVYHVIQLFNMAGNITNQWALGVDDVTPVSAGNGVSRAECIFDSETGKNLLRVDQFALGGEGGALGWTNVHHVVQLFDGNGNKTNEWYLAADDVTEVANDEGIARGTYLYAPGTNREIRRDLFAPKSQGGVFGEETVYHVILLFNAAGNVTNLQVLGVDDVTPVATSSGVSRTERIYDSETGENLLRQDQFALEGEGGALGWTNIHHVVQLYDGNGNMTNDWYLAADDVTEVPNDEGISHRAILYEPNTDRKIRRDLFAPKGKGGVFGWTNVHHVVQLFDGNGNMTNDWYLAADDVSEVADDEGISRRTILYEPNTDRRIRRDLFAPKGKGGVFGWTNIHHVVQLFDGNGNMTNSWYLAADDVTEVADDEGIARRIYVPNLATGRDVRRDFFAPKGQGGVFGDANAYHVIQLLNAAGNVTNQWILGVDDATPVAADIGVARAECSYDSETGEKLLRKDQFALGGEGGVFGWTNVHHVVQLFDGNGNMTNDWYLATDDVTEVADDEGISRRTILYEPNTGRRIRRDLFAPDGLGGVFGWTNVHHVVQLFDGNGNMTNDWYLAADDATEAASDEGISRRAFLYEPDTDREIRRDLFAPEGQGGVFGWANVHHVVRLYDGNGNQTNECYLATNGIPTTNDFGYAGYYTVYRDGKSEDSFFDENGRSVAMISVVYADSIAPGSQAEIGGVLVNDIIVQFGTYCINADGELEDLEESVKALRDEKKNLSVVRRIEGKWTLLHFSFESGIMGIRIKDRPIAKALFEEIVSSLPSQE